ncbi:hypothetical protein HY635_02165 [Candidatus Uhrbacteria bacterium]|nr:hypothetical protein [Candidatus Uhrbacteria bacterium]
MRAQRGWRRYARASPDRRRNPRPRRFIAAIILLAIIFASLSFGWRIRGVEVQGATIVPNAAVRDAALAVLQRQRWGVFPRSSMVWVGMNSLERELRQRFAFARVDGTRRRDGSIAIVVAEQPIAAIARFETGGAVLIARSGQVLGVAPEALNQAPLPTIQWAGQAPQTGDAFLTSATLEFLLSLWRELDLAGGALRPSTMSRRDGSDGAFDIRTTSGTVIAVVVNDQPNDQLLKLQSLLRDRPTPEERSKLRSIDLRYGDRVYIQ